MYCWTDTLLKYLRFSNEDDRVVSFLKSSVLPLLGRHADAIEWIEVGPGPGTKTWEVMRSLLGCATPVLCRARLLEPSPAWRRYLMTHRPNWLRSRGDVEVLVDSSTFEAFAERITAAGPAPSFITILHVLYEPSLVDHAIDYLRSASRRSVPLVACLVVESEDGDLSILRQKLAELGFAVPFVAAPTIRQRLRDSGLCFTASQIGGQYCLIPTGSAHLRWLLAFLLGCDRTALRKIPPPIRAQAYASLKAKLASRPGQRMCVPDIAFVIEMG
jgi:hypothetical protein